MKKSLHMVLFVIVCASMYNWTFAQRLDDYKYDTAFDPMENTVRTQMSFNGYTNYWHDAYREWVRYGNLFKMGIPNVEYTIAQSKVDIAEELQLLGFSMQEGFLNGLMTGSYLRLDQPTMQKLEASLKQGNIMVYVDPESEVGKKLMEKIPEKNPWKKKLKSHQYNAGDFSESHAFYLTHDDRKLFVVSAKTQQSRDRIKVLIENTQDILSQVDLHRGWFGAKTLLKSVTCMHGHPLEVIGRGMNQGNTWFTFSGYMDFLMKEELTAWIDKVGNPVVTDVGVYNLYGCKDYDGLQIQNMDGEEAWIAFAREKDGYLFRPVYDPNRDAYQYDGYMAGLGNKEQIDGEDIPFVSETGPLQNDAASCMVLFVKKGEPLTRERMWEAILDRRAVSVLEQAKMMGPQRFRNALQMLMLDRAYLEEYFGDRIHLEAFVDGYQLNVTVTNTFAHPVSGRLELVLPPELKLQGNASVDMILTPRSTRSIKCNLLLGPESMDKANPILIRFNWDNHIKSTLTMLDLPRAISVHQLLYGHAPRVTYPVTIHNFSATSSFPVRLQVVKKDKSGETIFETTQMCSAGLGTFENLSFTLDIPAGHYDVKVSTLGVENWSQLGVGKPRGKPVVHEEDLNGDGIPEYRMENEHVRVTLLATGARVIEYIVKEKNDNVFFKLWPEQAVDHKRPFRRRGYYPYGGFEDFLGQASMETHKVYDAEIIIKEGDCVRVKMTADYYGNKLEKIFTLYGDSPLLEVRFALTFRNPEANVIGPQPILELGRKHWIEDVFTVPTFEGLKAFRMRPEDYYGQIIHLKEGWNAGYDSEEDITFIGAFPVTEPLFLHMWMNHPKNNDAHHYYAEFQPWVPIYQKSTMYFSYYIWGAGGPWKDGVDALRQRNLITNRSD